MIFRLVLVGLALSIAGCGTAEIFEQGSSTASPVPVSGVVKFRGYVLNGGWIVFVSESAGGDMVTTEVYSDGSFHLTEKGLKPGIYRMSVTNHTSAHWALPNRYSNPQLSGLTCTVKENQPIRLRIELE
jgi:hypothetical protein